MPSSILNVNGLEATLVFLAVLNNTNPACVSATCHHHHIPHVKLDEVHNLVGLKIKLDGVICLDQRIRVADRTAVIRVQVGDALLAKLDRADLAKLELCNLL